MKNSKLSSKCCIICGTKGHTKLSCPLMQAEKGLSPITQDQKKILAQKLLSNSYHTEQLNAEPVSPYITYSSSVRGLSIHGKYQYKTKIYCNCSIFKEKDPQGPKLKKKMFAINLVIQLINRNQDTVIINEMNEIITLSQDDNNNSRDLCQYTGPRLDNNISTNNTVSQLRTRSMFPNSIGNNDIGRHNTSQSFLQSTSISNNMQMPLTNNLLMPPRNIGYGNYLGNNFIHPITYANIPLNPQDPYHNNYHLNSENSKNI